MSKRVSAMMAMATWRLAPGISVFGGQDRSAGPGSGDGMLSMQSMFIQAGTRRVTLNSGPCRLQSHRSHETCKRNVPCNDDRQIEH